jgi:hypothetical protein
MALLRLDENAQQPMATWSSLLFMSVQLLITLTPCIRRLPIKSQRTVVRSNKFTLVRHGLVLGIESLPPYVQRQPHKPSAYVQVHTLSHVVYKSLTQLILEDPHLARV